MIIDVHYHLVPALGRGTARHMAKYTVEAARRVGLDLDLEQCTQEALETFADPEGEHLLKRMDDAGIDVTVFCMVDNYAIPGSTLEAARVANERAATVALRHPDRFVALAGVDPRRPEAVDLLRRCLDDFGMKGLKLHPDHGYDPVSPESFALYEIVQERKGVVLIHTGPILPPGRGATYAHPLLLEDLAVDFPDLPVIAAHMGQAWWRDWAGLASVQSTLYGDLAEWQILAKRSFPLFCKDLREIIDRVGIEKVLFGTDGPVLDPVVSSAEYVRIVKSLTERSPHGIKFMPEETAAILGENAVRIFGTFLP